VKEVVLWHACTPGLTGKAPAALPLVGAAVLTRVLGSVDSLSTCFGEGRLYSGPVRASHLSLGLLAYAGATGRAPR
jgi:hypothetical protein